MITNLHKVSKFWRNVKRNPPLPKIMKYYLTPIGSRAGIYSMPLRPHGVPFVDILSYLLPQ